ncbi:MAG: DUF1003 domain-containing protein [Saprospiraceae bacterium]|nr:DUF1003 domain-containing protein [Saprospiraceae bacterium]
MEKRSLQYVQQLMETENLQLAKLHDIVRESLEEESLLAQRLQEDSGLNAPTYGEKVADKVATFGGSWTFIISFGVVLMCWITLNSLILAGKAFDPFPYILLNLVLSCIAALQAPVIMMSQNRKETKDRQRAENDYLINLKSEIEIRHLHQKIDLSIVDQYRHLCDIQQKQLEILTDLQGQMDVLAKKIKG